MSAGPWYKIGSISQSHRVCGSWRVQQLGENKVTVLKSFSFKGKCRTNFTFATSTFFFFFPGSRSNCTECTQRFPCTVKQCKSIGFLSFSFPEHFSELEAKPSSQLGWHLFSIGKVNQKKVKKHALNPTLTLSLFNCWVALTHFWSVPDTVSQTEEDLSLGYRWSLVLQPATGPVVRAAACTLSEQRLGPREQGLEGFGEGFQEF